MCISTSPLTWWSQTYDHETLVLGSQIHYTQEEHPRQEGICLWWHEDGSSPGRTRFFFHSSQKGARIQRKLAILKQHCEAVGRDYESIHRTASAFCSIGETHEQAMAKIPEVFLELLRHLGTTTLIGSPATIREGLAALEAAGVQEVLLLFPDALQLDSLRLFANAFI